MILVHTQVALLLRRNRGGERDRGEGLPEQLACAGGHHEGVPGDFRRIAHMPALLLGVGLLEGRRAVADENGIGPDIDDLPRQLADRTAAARSVLRRVGGPVIAGEIDILLLALEGVDHDAGLAIPEPHVEAVDLVSFSLVVHDQEVSERALDAMVLVLEDRIGVDQQIVGDLRWSCSWPGVQFWWSASRILPMKKASQFGDSPQSERAVSSPVPSAKWCRGRSVQ